MDNDSLGQLCAFLTAIVWAMAVVLFKMCGETIAPLALNLFKNTVGIVLLAVSLIVIQSGFDDMRSLSSADFMTLAISGVVGIAIADTLFYMALNRVGVGIQSIVDCTYGPFAILFAVVFLHESLGPLHYVGSVLILVGVLVSSKHKPPVGATGTQLVHGILLGTLAMALTAGGIVYAKPVLSKPDCPLLWATTLRLLAGTIPLAVWGAVSSERRTIARLFRPTRVWRIAIPGAVLGGYLAMLLWVAGFKYADASVAAMINQTSVVFALIFASIILKESFTRRKGVAVLFALGGGLVMVVA
ncbi:MAG: DMT family transporter [Planctomycetes bacterium]|nr:DMT family transporter [Planctomycetota bacterium]